MTSSYYYYLIFISFLFLQTACEKTPPKNQDASQKIEKKYAQAYDALPDNEAGKLIQETIKAAGGWETWLNKSSMSFIKNITQYDTTGTEKYTESQLHQYQLFPSFKARISWERDGEKHLIINNGEQSWRLKNGVIQTEENLANSAYNSSFGSHYVINMPFKLVDPGTKYVYEGKTKLPDGEEARSIAISYEEGAGSAALYHTWKYFFHPEKPQLSANFLDYGNGYTYTEYLDFTDIDGITFNVERLSYRTDKEMKALVLKTRYKNTEIQFGTPLDSELFEPE